MATTFKQDMPPKGGYGNIDYKRMLPKRGMSGYMMFAGCAGIMTFGFVTLAMSMKQKRKWIQEDREAKLGIMPLICAEKEREMLLRLQYNREQEAEIMKDVPGWKVGEGVFNSNRWYEPGLLDLYFLEPSGKRNKLVFGYNLFTGS